METCMHSYMSHIGYVEKAVIECVDQKDSRDKIYPVLRIGDASFFPSVAQLETLHEVIGKYLGEQKPKDSFDKQVDADLEAAHEAFASGG